MALDGARVPGYGDADADVEERTSSRHFRR